MIRDDFQMVIEGRETMITFWLSLYFTARAGRRKLEKKEIEKLLKMTPSKKKSSDKFLRGTGTNGMKNHLISFLSNPKKKLKFISQFKSIKGQFPFRILHNT